VGRKNHRMLPGRAGILHAPVVFSQQHGALLPAKEAYDREPCAFIG
jgi:hypothetical protein